MSKPRTTPRPEMICMRVEPCNCGCGGTDALHRRRLTRVVQNRALVYAFPMPIGRDVVVERGEITLGGSVIAVSRIAYQLPNIDHATNIGWYGPKLIRY